MINLPYLKIISIAFLSLPSVFLIILMIHFYNFKNIDIENNLKSHFDHELKKKRSFKEVPKYLFNNINQNSLVILGASAAVLPDGCFSKRDDKFNFPSLLEKEITHLPLNIINLSYCGHESIRYLKVTEKILKNDNKPKVIFIYAGNNEFTNASVDIFEKYSLFNYSKIGKFLEHKISKNQKHLVFEFIRNKIDPFVLGIYKKLFPEFLNADNFITFNKQITSNFIQNMQKIVILAQKHDIKVVLMPAIANLAYPPFYQNSKFKSYIENNNIDALIKISDDDNWARDRRTKSFFYEEVKKLKGVYIIDIYSKLKSKNNIKLYNHYFEDVFHFSKAGHVFIKNEILNIIKKNPKAFNL
jgi:lysophospholipase L1-like esterase